MYWGTQPQHEQAIVARHKVPAMVRKELTARKSAAMATPGGRFRAMSSD
jgi:hypothetical protein